MRRHLAVLTVLALLFAGCGDDSGDDAASLGGESPDETSRPDSEDAPSDEDLEGLLLTLEDLPSGWAVDPESDDGSDDGDDDDEGMPECLREAPETDDSLATATASFLGGEDFPTLEESLDRLDPDTVDQQLDLVEGALDECGEFSAPLEDTELEMIGNITRVDLPTYGDRSAAWSMEMSAAGIDFSFLILFAAQDDLVLSFFYGNVGTEAVREAQPLVEQAFAKLATS